jgi:hypothetical protein
MYRVDHFSGSTTLPLPTPARTAQGLYFTGGTPSNVPGDNIPATVCEAEFLNAIQEELCNIVFAAGEELDKSDRAQLARCVYKVSHPSGGGPSGPSMYEPPATGTPYARAYNGTAGRWDPAIEEPPDNGRPYARAWAAGDPAGQWVSVTGQGRALGDMDFYVARDGDNDNDGLTPATAWADIQYAVDAVCDRLDAGGFVITINVGDSGAVAWPGFVVTQPLVNAPEMGFRVVGSSSTGANRMNCRLGGCAKPGYEGYGIYANGMNISVSNFTFDGAPSQVPHSGAYICADGSDTTIWIEKEVACYSSFSNNPVLFARAGAFIIVDEQLICSNTPAWPPNSANPPGPTDNTTWKGVFAADQLGQIIIEDSRNGEFGISKPRAVLQAEGPIAGRMLYVNRGGVIDFGSEGTFLPRAPAAGNWGSAVAMMATGLINANPNRGIMSNTRSGAVPIYYGLLATAPYSAGSGKFTGAMERMWSAEQWSSGALIVPVP